MPTGTVKWFNSQKGQPQGGGKDVFSTFRQSSAPASAGSMRGRQSNMKKCRIEAKHQRVGADRAPSASAES
jgi:hypothetical protein